MNTQRDQQRIFAIASEIQDPELQVAYLRDACGDDECLRELISQLLQRDREQDGLLDRPLPTVMPSLQNNSPVCIGMQIGPYTLRERIGEGGMGEVYVAEQTEPVSRKVALKIIKPGMASKDVVARFEAERQALALMDHTNIARVFDGGATENGQLFFVMELVRGLPITEYCEQERLSIAARLQLFLHVCRAVQHAHQKGIIHRDIKPTNVLVPQIDGEAVPKVIDFGVAKAMNQKLTEATIYTQFEQVVGTPLYMSPEQAGSGVVDLDTRSDVYSLGVLLYELLTGNTPFDRETLKKHGFDQFRRILREEEPRRPSQLVSTLNAEALSTISERRACDPRKLTQTISGELDWIAMKALEKDRSRRYQTANEFAADVERYLCGEVVHARPASALYRFRKFTRRNRPYVIAASLVVLVLILGIGGTTWGLIRADRRRIEAEKNLAFATKSNAILGSVFANLDPYEDYTTLAEFRSALQQNLKQAVQELQRSSIGGPLEVAAMQRTLGESLLGLGETEMAINVLRQSCQTCEGQLGPTHPDTLSSKQLLALAYKCAGQLDLALPLLEKTLELREATLGESHPATLTSMDNLGQAYQDAGRLERALPLYEKVLKLRKASQGESHLATLTSMNNLGQAYRADGHLDRALPLLERALELSEATLGENHPHTLMSMDNLASTQLDAGRLDQALPLLEKTLKLKQSELGREHPETLVSMNSLGSAYVNAGKIEKAVSLLEQSLELSKAKLGEDHRVTLHSMDSLARAYVSGAQPDRAVPLLEELLEIKKSKLGKDHPDTLLGMNNLARAYQDDGKLDESLLLLEKTLELEKVKLGKNDPRTLITMNNVAAAYEDAGHLDQAVPTYEELLENMKAVLGEYHPTTLVIMNNLASAYKANHQPDRAIPLFEQALELMQINGVENYPHGITTMTNLASAYADTGKRSAAIKLIDKILPASRKRFAKDSLALAAKLASCGHTLLELAAFDAAEPLIRECLAIRRQQIPDRWSRFYTASLLGGIMLGQKKYAEAERLLLEGYEGMKQRREMIPASSRNHIVDAAERLVRLYEATGDKAEVGKWKKEIASLHATGETAVKEQN